MIQSNRNIIILYGGPSQEAAISRKSALNVLQACIALEYYPTLIEIGSCDIEKMLISMHNPIILNLVHGAWGEDGQAPALFEKLNLPYFGCGPKASILTFDKLEFRNFVQDFARIPDGEAMDKVGYLAHAAYPHILKTPNSGSTIGVFYVNNAENKVELIQNWPEDEIRIVEQFIDGIEGSLVVYKNKVMGGNIVNYAGPIFDYNAKYDPSISKVEDWNRIDQDIRAELSEASIRIYAECNCEGFLLIDFRLSKDNIPYILEANSIPGMTQTSLTPHVFGLNGFDFKAMVQLMIDDVASKTESQTSSVQMNYS